jgi:hypothetical protein
MTHRDERDETCRWGIARELSGGKNLHILRRRQGALRRCHQDQRTGRYGA